MISKNIQKLNLQNYNVFYECDPYDQLYFDVSGIMGRTLGYGKHPFTIGITTPSQNLAFISRFIEIF